MITAPIINLLLTIDGRVFPIRAPEKYYNGASTVKLELPYMVINQISVIDTSETKSDTSQMDSYRYQVSCFGSTHIEAESLAEKVRTKLDGYSGITESIVIDHIYFLDENDLYDEEAEIFHIAQDYKIIVHN